MSKQKETIEVPLPEFLYSPPTDEQIKAAESKGWVYSQVLNQWQLRKPIDFFTRARGITKGCRSC
jgi:hypothetical protein